MKYKILSIIFLLFIAACSSPQTFVCPDGSTVTDLATCPPEEQEEVVEEEEVVPPVPEEKEAEVVIDIDEKTQELIDKAESKVTSFSFVYVGPPENLPKDTYNVLGDKILVEILRATDFKQSQDFSHVYVDTSRKTATAYCEIDDRVWCPGGVVKHGKVPYADYNVKTPYQWLKEIQTAKYIGNGPKFEGSQTTKIEFTTADTGGEMIITNFYGMPARINLDDGTEIEFRDLDVNTVKDADVTPPTV